MDTNQKHRIAFFGTPSFTEDFLIALAENGYTPSLIVTNPDRKAGRGHSVSTPTPKTWALAHNIPVLQPEKLDDDFSNTLKKTPWDLFIVIAYGNIIPEDIITVPKYGTINVHYSLLPKYRGATPIEAAILHGDNTTGVTIQQMSYALDSGDILAKEEISITPTDTTQTLRARLNATGISMLPEVLQHIFDGTITKTPQGPFDGIYCKKIPKSKGELNLTDDPIMLDRTFRAYSHSPGTFFIHNGIRIKIKSAHLADGQFIIDTVIPQNGKLQSYAQFLQNHPLENI